MKTIALRRPVWAPSHAATALSERSVDWALRNICL